MFGLYTEDPQSAHSSTIVDRDKPTDFATEYHHNVLRNTNNRRPLFSSHGRTPQTIWPMDVVYVCVFVCTLTSHQAASKPHFIIIVFRCSERRPVSSSAGKVKVNQFCWSGPVCGGAALDRLCYCVCSRRHQQKKDHHVPIMQ